MTTCLQLAATNGTERIGPISLIGMDFRWRKAAWCGTLNP